MQRPETVLARPARPRASSAGPALAAVIARAAPPAERVAGGYFRPAAADSGPGARLARWRAAVADDEAGFAAYLAAAGTSEAGLRASLADVVLADAGSLPPWAAELAELVESAAAAGTGAAGPAADLDAVVAPFLARARGVLAAHAARHDIGLDPAAADGMVAVLRRRLAEVLTPLLGYEQRARSRQAPALRRMGESAPSRPDLAADWLDRLSRYPVAGFLLGTVTMRWSRYFEELLARLAADRKVLGEALFGGTAPGRVIGCTGDAGDRHDEGRAVAVLELDAGRVVYKPKDLRCAAAVLGLAARLNDLSGAPDLHVRRIVLRPGYAWEQFVPHEPCRPPAELGLFYRRMGMTIRLIQFLEGRDFWLDNLVANGAIPAFIDLETVLQPRPATGLAGAEGAAWNLLAESVADTGAVVMMTPVSLGLPAQDLGALSAGSHFLAPFRRDGAAGRLTGSPPSGSDFVSWSHPEHRPAAAGTVGNPAAHLTEITEGYGLMQERLTAARSELLRRDGPLAGLRDAPVRFLHRDTWTYYRIGQASVAPRLLTDAVERELYLHRLFRGISAGPGDGYERRAAAVRSEIGALRGLDIPLFLSLPSDDTLRAGDGTTVPGFFEGTAWDRLARRARQLPGFPVVDHLALLRSCFATGHHPPEQAAPWPVRRAAPPAPGRWTEEATRIGLLLLRSAARGPDGLAWLGVAWHPQLSLSSVQVLPADLLSGTCGIALFLADLYAVTGDPAWRQAAADALAGTLRAVAGKPVPGGAVTGAGALVYTLGYCGRRLGRPALAQLADAAVPAEDWPATGDRGVAAGLTGLLLALVSAPGAQPATRRSAAALAAALTAGAGPRAGDAEPAGAWPGTLPDAGPALALALARMGQAGAPPEPTWPTTTGNLLAALELGRRTGQPDAGTARCARQEAARLAAGPPSGRAIAEAVDLALAIRAADGDARPAAAATRLVSAALAEQRRGGSWFPASFTADIHQLSVLAGLPAIGRAMLRLDHPGLGAARLLDIGDLGGG